MASTPDQEARDRALSPKESFHLEAPAGSGKTSVLLARFLSLLARVETPENLLALTFTRKAAGELRTRVMDLLWRRPDPDAITPPWERRLLDLAQQVFRHYDRPHGGLQELLAPERLPVMTFHSFCAQLLRYAPQEAGVSLEFRLLEEDEARWLKQEALEEFRRRLAARPAPDPTRQALIRRLVRLNNSWPRLAGELRDLLGRRDCLGEFLELAHRTRDPGRYEELLAARFQLLLSPVLENLAALLAASDLGRSWPEFREAVQNPSLPRQVPGVHALDLASWQAMAEVLLTQKGELRKAFDPKYGFPEGFKNTPWPGVIQQLPPDFASGLKQCRNLHPAAARPEEVAALQDLVILLGESLDVYEELCAQRQALDFIALEQAALRLLAVADPSDLLLRLDRRLTHLLVDEFQDTSEAQMTLLCRLLEGWDLEAGRTLMVVGDPKQSIYGWRQAKVRLFQASRRGLPCAGAGTFPLEPLRLTANFRSSATLIDWANRVFGETVMAGASPEGVEFHAATPGPDAGDSAPPRLALFSGESQDAAREAEARWLARQVAQAAADLQNDEKIGILLFARTHLRTYLTAFQAAGLALKVKEGLKLADSLVVQHLHNLTRALVRPQDEAAWAGVLRGPWVRVSLGLLTQVALTPGDLWPGKLRRFAGESLCPPDLANIIEGLLISRTWVGRRPLREIITGFLDEADAWPGLAALEGPPGVANARAYLDLLAAGEAGLPEATFTQAGFNLPEAFQPPDPRAQDAAVELLTVHGAKGLEYDQVFIPFLDWQPLKNESKTPPFLLEEIPGSRVHGLALARPYLQEKQSSLYVLLRTLKERRILEEARRVFYVAVTRARRGLTLSGVLNQNKQGEFKPPGNSPLGWLWQHYRPEAPGAGSGAVWPEPEIRAELVSEVPALTPAPPKPRELPQPLEVCREALPYQMEFPSQLAEQAGAVAGVGANLVFALDAERTQGSLQKTYPFNGDEVSSSSGGDDTPKIRGEVTHRLMETLSKGEALPSSASMAAALRQEGLAPEAAARLAPEILAEASACRRDSFLVELLEAETPPLSEWLLEEDAGAGRLRRGQIDLLAFDGRNWWIVDYKTSRPGSKEDWEDFIRGETEKYRPQLLAYREMVARMKGISPEDIRLALYFTGCQWAVEIW
ncbi:MAG: UvrD-helicase domain-containing protein [Syntrophales bacterium]|nr:UvrD-helicase domain-containing protein [Syntrophales bacterium]